MSRTQERVGVIDKGRVEKRTVVELTRYVDLRCFCEMLRLELHGLLITFRPA